MISRQWKLPAPDPDADRALAEKIDVSPVLATLLRHRGLADPQQAWAYLHPRLRDLSHPFTLKDMEKASQRLRRAIADGENVLVYGDYDVDGMTGTAVLMNFIRLAGGKTSFYIPNRLKEGYSFNEEALDSILDREDPPGVVVTVDHGTSAHEGIARLADAGVDVIVTDHHSPPARLPDRAHALVNPHQLGCPSTFKNLCGAAVAYKLAWGTAEAFSGQRKVSQPFREFLLDSMALVSLATVTDVVPLVGENRVLCFHGLRALPVSKNPGIQALLGRSRLTGSAVRAVHVGFRLGPRLNAAGRMGLAETAIELLTTDDATRARAVATRLEEANDRRRAIEKEMLEEILASKAIRDFTGDHGLCLGKVGWHPGVIGIVAARLVDRFAVPAFIAGLNGDHGRGSTRSIPGVNVKEVLDELTSHLVTHGGHPGAAGATVTEASFPAFKQGFEETTRRALATMPGPPGLDVDLEISFRGIRPELVEELEMLAPHGHGNPPALFCTRKVAVAGEPRVVGSRRKHLVFHAREGGRTFRAVLFGGADHLPLLRTPGVLLDIAYRLKFDSYGNPGSIELEIQDLVRTGD